MSVGLWSILKELKDVNIWRLAKALPKALLQSRTTSATQKYLGAFKHWKMWATSHQLDIFPAEATHLRLYLQYLRETMASKSAVEKVVDSLA